MTSILDQRLQALAFAVKGKIDKLTARSVPSGGASGQVLVKASNADYAYSWSALPAGPAGAKGDTGDVTPAATAAATAAATSATNAATSAASAAQNGPSLTAVVGLDASGVALTTLGATTNTAASVSDPSNYYGYTVTSVHDTYVAAVRINFAGAATAQMLVVDAGGVVLSDQTVTASGAGVVSTSVAKIVPAGSMVLVRPVTGSGFFYTGGGSNPTVVASAYSGTVGSTLSTLPHNTAVLAAIAVDTYSPSSGSHTERLNNVVAAIGMAPSVFGDTSTNTSVNVDTADWFGTTDFTLADGILQTVRLRMSDVGVFRLILVNGANVVTWDQQYSTAGGVVTLHPNVAAAKGSRLFYKYVSGGGIYYAAGGNGLSFAASAYTNSVGDDVPPGANSLTLALQWEVSYTAPSSAAYVAATNNVGFDQRIADGMITASALKLTTGILLRRNDTYRQVAEVRTFTAATNVRYDLLTFDPVAETFSVVAGSDRATDAAEYLPTPANAHQMPVASVRVTSSAITFVPLWNTFDHDNADLMKSLVDERRRGRRCLPKLLNRIRRGQSIRIVGIGDSITAMTGSGSTGAYVTPNGAGRDQAAVATGYLTVNLASDTVAAVPQYTAVQLGRTDDGAGATHTKVGWNWALVAYLASLGYTLGTDLFYDNFGVNGATTNDAVSGLPTSGWAYAAAHLGANVAVIALGQNEQGQTYTEANLVTIAQTFQAQGAEVIFIGCTRPRSPTLASWEYTNRAIERAARFTNSAFVPMLPLYDARYIGTIGITTADCSDANGNNHPGLTEHAAIGRDLVKLFLD